MIRRTLIMGRQPTKLTLTQVGEIRHSLSLGVPQKVLAEKYGVTTSMICQINTGRKHRNMAMIVRDTETKLEVVTRAALYQRALIRSLESVALRRGANTNWERLFVELAVCTKDLEPIFGPTPEEYDEFTS